MTSSFPSLRLEGGLIGADLIEQIADGSAPGQKPADFSPQARHLSDEIAAAWGAARDQWAIFQKRLARLPENESAVRLTRDQWIIPLLSLLDYELDYQPRASEVDGLTYAISHRLLPSPVSGKGRRGEAAPEDDPGLPIHIIECRQSLDRRPESGRPRLAAHVLLQEYLNRSEHLWGLATNGLTLRLLRDSQRLRRQAYIEFDLRSMFEGEQYADFGVFFRLLHRSRLPQGMADAEACLLERYHRLTVEQGGRVRERLREGVEQALKVFGAGLLAHPANAALREQASTGALPPVAYYRQLLRLIYRLLFLMVAEERGLVSQSDLYRQHYSLGRLRGLAAVRSAYTAHGDLWQALQVTFDLCRDERAGATLGLPPLNGDLFSAEGTQDLNQAQLSNQDLLTALWQLCMYHENERAPWRRVNYAALDVEELGSVYESLLDYRPAFIQQGPGRLTFDLLPGDERRETGSHYTPPELVHELIQHALEPALREKLAAVSGKPAAAREKALLALKVCDPAAGSGHFLLAAARRLGRELARIRSGDDEPAPEALRRAVRDVITHCIYGVDKNPLAVDLCRVALWIEGHDRDRPLTFLNHRIRPGDSLVGVLDLKVLEDGIPDAAFEALPGDDKKTARSCKELNARYRDGENDLFSALPAGPNDALARTHQAFSALPDDTPTQVRAKRRAYEALQARGGDWQRQQTACHLWTAAFFQPYLPSAAHPLAEDGSGVRAAITTDALRSCLKTNSARGDLIGQAWALAGEARHPFFHWAVEFPDVFAQGGFDVILGNPPFVGGLKISGNEGDKYRHFLTFAFRPFEGRVDLCAAFFRRGYDMLKHRGRLGMIAVNSIGQGETRASGLSIILSKGGIIHFAKRFIKWPGQANVEVNLIALSNTNLQKDKFLDGQTVEYISSRLDEDIESRPQALKQNEHKAFQGIVIRGIGFTLDLVEVDHLIRRNPKNSERLFPFLNGEDINDHPQQKPSRQVIYFEDWPLEKAAEYPDLLAIVEDKVKPERLKLPDNSTDYRKLRERWWQFARFGLDLRDATKNLSRILTRSRVSELHMVVFVPKNLVYSDATVVFAFDDDYHFALLQSNIHEAWVGRQSSSLESRTRYTPTDCFDTFPFPQQPAETAAARAGETGGQYHEHRRQVMLARQLGLTKTYNLFHNPACADDDIARLRQLHASLDQAILACYGWEDVEAGHGFWQNERGQTRYTIRPEARRELLRRLLELNQAVAAREAQEQAASAAAAKARPAAAESRAAPRQKKTPAAASPAAEYGLYRCLACDQTVLGFACESHVREQHEGRAVGWKKVE